MFLAPLISRFYFFWMDWTWSNGNWKVRRLVHRKMVNRGRAVVYAFDRQLTVLSTYQLCPSVSFLFSTQRGWTLSKHRAMQMVF